MQFVYLKYGFIMNGSIVGNAMKIPNVHNEKSVHTSSKPPCIPLPDLEDLKCRKFKSFRNIGSILYLWICSYFGSIFLLTPCLILVYISPKAFRQIADNLLLWWFMFAEVSFIIIFINFIYIHNFIV